MRLVTLGLLLVLAACTSQGSSTAGNTGNAPGVYIGGTAGAYFGAVR